MKYQVHLVLLLIFALVEPNYGLGGGKRVPIREYPYAAKIVDSCGAYQSGSIVHPSYILTTGIYINTYLGMEPIPDVILRIYVGDETEDWKSPWHKVQKVMVDPKLDLNPKPVLKLHNIGFVKLRKPLEFNDRIKSIPLEFNNKYIGRDGWAVSYGQLTKDIKSDCLNAARVKIGWCLQTTTNRYFWCSEPENRKSYCPGDIGGALVLYGKQVGVVIGGNGFCEEQDASIFFNNLTDSKWWIESILRGE